LAVHEEEYMHRKHVYEEHAYVLDYLPYGRSSEKSRHLVVPTAQIMGERYFTLLEAELKVGATVAVPETDLYWTGSEGEGGPDHRQDRIRPANC